MNSSKRNSLRRTDNAAYRLAKRKVLFWKLRLISDITLGTALFGILMMVFEVELVLTGISTPNDPPTFFLKLAISTSTVILLVFLIWYHVTDMELRMNDNFVESWLLAITPKRIIVVCLELMVCSIHPPPQGILSMTGGVEPMTGQLDDDGDTEAIGKEMGTAKWRRQHDAVIPLDIYLSILMFLRGFLVCRAVALHSKLFTDASMLSLGAMNRIRFTFSFIFRSMMLVHPVRILVCLILTVLITASWTLRACDPSHLDMPSSVWLIIITFLTVGYGDLVPQSYCGRLVAVFTGFFGIGCMALVVAVLTQKLEMSTAESYVHNFVTIVQLQNGCKEAAANVVRSAWLSYRAQSRCRGSDSRIYYHHRCLMAALHVFRQIKQQKRLLSEGNVRLVDLYNAQKITAAAVSKLETRMSGVEKEAGESLARLEIIQQQLSSIERLIKAPY